MEKRGITDLSKMFGERDARENKNFAKRNYPYKQKEERSSDENEGHLSTQ